MFMPSGYGEQDVVDALMIGDENIGVWFTDSLICEWTFKKISEKGCRLARALDMLEENMSDSIRCVYIQATHHELVYETEGIQRPQTKVSITFQIK